MTSPTRTTTGAEDATATAKKRYGPAVGEPPLLVDPRRWGSLIGLAGGMVFIASYSAAPGRWVSAVAWAIGVTLLLVALYAHYVRPVPLGPLVRPRPLALTVYVVAVVGEIGLISVGSRALVAADQSTLRPALIAAVVGLHFVPFAWAFRERMFLFLGGAVAGIGLAGLVVGSLVGPPAADAAAVIAGLVMLAMIAAYARGRFAPRPTGTGPATAPGPP
ncbi:hypothetical protein ACTMSW_29355 [Micromonospora sp. BQ11]|uniref:hypothetical protein n=1 Tax=Micromonospora sp. BQ11 TaxID=3452212 RepID=UPI003F88A351